MKTRILVIDDNTEFLQSVAKAFDDGFVVDTATNGEEGLKKAGGADCILLDLVMPIMDGFTFLDNFEKGETKVIVVSALSQDSFVAKAMEKGADYYVVKPTSAECIRAKVEEALTKRWSGGKSKIKLWKNASLTFLFRWEFLRILRGISI